MAERVRVEVAYALPERQWLFVLDLPAGSIAGEALRQSGLDRETSLPEPLELSIFGRLCRHDTVLAEGDRVEVLRPLVFDPKESRRRRAAHAARANQSAAASAAGSSPARTALPGS
jgi:uncharacterized protein